MAVGVNEESQW